jgi:hypothetical protein
MSIGGDRDDVVEWGGQFSWDVFTEGQPNIFMALGVMWLCYQGFGTVGELNGKLFDGKFSSNVLDAGGGKVGDKGVKLATNAVAAATGVIGTAVGAAGTGLLGAGRGLWNWLRAPPQPSAPAPHVHVYRDGRRSNQKAASRIARKEAEFGRPLTAKERLRDRESGVNDAQAEAERQHAHKIARGQAWAQADGGRTAEGYERRGHHEQAARQNRHRYELPRQVQGALREGQGTMAGQRARVRHARYRVRIERVRREFDTCGPAGPSGERRRR